MDIVRISALSPPEKDKSKWARNLLIDALDRGLTAKLVPAHSLKSFTVTLPTHIAQQLREQAELQAGSVTTPVYAAGLIEAAKESALSASADDEGDASQAKPSAIVGIDRVRPLLHGLLSNAVEQSDNGKIVFAEAATGTGKGRMIASIAAHAAQQGRSVVVSAPLAVTWQLIEQLGELKKETPFTMSLALGRPNFVSPEAVRVWAQANDHAALLSWVDSGGKALSDRAVMVSKFIGRELRWLLEDALSLADDLPVSIVGLADDGDPDECEGESIYRSLRKLDEAPANIYLCSHFMLAAHARQMQMRQHTEGDTTSGYSLPAHIDTLIVDEAHQLEGAFAAIYSHALHLRTLERAIQNDVKRGRKPLLDALSVLGGYIQKTGKKTARLEDMDGLAPILQSLLLAADGVQSKTLPAHTRAMLNVVRNGIRAALSGYMTLSTDVSAVRRYPQITIGRASLEKAMLQLWDNTAGAVLVSATLYGDNNDAKLVRWKLGVPVERTCFLPPVHPSWTFDAVTLHDKRVTCKPDDSSQWADEAANVINEIALNAAGGTLILCTSFLNADQLALRLKGALGDRLITQSSSMSASMCAMRYKTLYQQGIKPVWIGLGSAWTGIDLSDESVEPENDHMLTDLIVTRLPFGANRTIMHERRVRIAGFSVVIQEASWHLRQGIGRLVRRKGAVFKNLWVLDSRLDGDEIWVKRLNKTLVQRYKRS